MLEFWGLGDLVIASPFLRAASEKFTVTLLAKPFAEELRPRLWPEVQVATFTATWTAFHGKYQLWRWPLREMVRLRRRLVAENFDFAVSGRWDPRDHLVLQLSRARQRLGFSRLKSRRYLTQELARPDALAHRYEFWRIAGRALGLDLPAREDLLPPVRRHQGVTNAFEVTFLVPFRRNNMPTEVEVERCYEQAMQFLRNEAAMVVPSEQEVASKSVVTHDSSTVDNEETEDEALTARQRSGWSQE